jgi:thiamine biosynthesis lipoprotein
MGTRLQIQVFPEGGDREAAQKAIDAAFAELARVEALMSEWSPESEISRVNRGAGASAPVTVSKEVLDVLTRGKEVAAVSNGAFAMTWAVLSSLWNFNQGDSAKKLPDQGRVEARRGLIGDDKIVLDAAKNTVRLPTADMALGLGAIAKGYAIDKALGVLAAAGFKNALVFAGGDIGTSGTKGDKPWLVGIQDPRAAGYFATVTLRDEAVATSGDYEKYFEIDGVRYHHILDPRTGFPAKGCRSVTIIAKDAITADALATAVFVLGPEAGMALIEKQGVGGVIVDADNNIAISTHLRDRVRILRAPTK